MIEHYRIWNDRREEIRRNKIRWTKDKIRYLKGKEEKEKNRQDVKRKET